MCVYGKSMRGGGSYGYECEEHSSGIDAEIMETQSTLFVNHPIYLFLVSTYFGCVDIEVQTILTSLKAEEPFLKAPVS